MKDLYNSNSDNKEDLTNQPELPVVENSVLENTKKPVSLVSSERRLWSFYVKPKSIKFETQDPEEEVLLLLRKHPVTNLWWILISILLLIAPMVFEITSFLAFLPAGFSFMSILLWYLVSTAFVLENLLSWLFNVYIVTDERIIDVDFHNLSYREISETKIDKIQDVSFSMGGVMSVFFNYGDVIIQTAGTVSNFDFMAVPEPATVVKILQQLRTEEEQEAIEGRIR